MRCALGTMIVNVKALGADERRGKCTLCIIDEMVGIQPVPVIPTDPFWGRPHPELR